MAYVVAMWRRESRASCRAGSSRGYVVPAAFVPLERLPLTPEGKLERKAPRTPVEEVLAEIRAEMPRLERVGVTESFFELGGHSPLAPRVASRARAVMGGDGLRCWTIELPPRALFEGPKAAELARVLAERGEVALADRCPGRPPAPGPARTSWGRGSLRHH